MFDEHWERPSRFVKHLIGEILSHVNDIQQTNVGTDGQDLLNISLMRGQGDHGDVQHTLAEMVKICQTSYWQGVKKF